MKRWITALALVASLGSCQSMAGRMADFKADLAAEMQASAEADRQALAAYQARVDASLADVRSGLITQEDHIAAVAEAAKEREAALKASARELKDETRAALRELGDGVEADMVAVREAVKGVAGAAGSVLGLPGGEIGDLLAAAVAAILGTNTWRNHKRRVRGEPVEGKAKDPTA